jgi:hypothetical protein
MRVVDRTEGAAEYDQYAKAVVRGAGGFTVKRKTASIGARTGGYKDSALYVTNSPPKRRKRLT